MCEEKAYTLAVVGSPDCFSEGWRDIHDLKLSIQFVATQLGEFIPKWYSVGDNESFEYRLVDCLDCFTGKDAMSDNLS